MADEARLMRLHAPIHLAPQIPSVSMGIPLAQVLVNVIGIAVPERGHLANGKSEGEGYGTAPEAAPGITGRLAYS
jgi:hypothetical protein